MCGEHFIISARGLGKTGSSPHVRGALVPVRADDDVRGIIPACAGSTRLVFPSRQASWDHPRMCGEHRINDEHSRRLPGIIPACAGSTV